MQPDSDRDLTEFQWLIDHANSELRGDLPSDPVRLVTYFRKRHSPERCTLLVELLNLRKRGLAKFSRAEVMFFTSRGLAQATDERLATYKASRFPDRIRVVDLCCGIGGDLLALAARGPVEAVDKDARVLALAAANLRAHGREAARSCDDVRNVDVANFDAWHLDPDRRSGGTRRSSPSHCEPPVDVVQHQLKQNSTGAVKLSPAADISSLGVRDVEFEWLGHNRQCQQLVLWSGALSTYPGKRVATWLWNDSRGNPRIARVTEEHATPAPVANSVGRFLYEPKPSVLAAGLDDVLAARHGLKRLTAGIGYLSSDQQLTSEPLLSGFEILEDLPFRKHVLRRRVVALDGEVREVKKRGVDVNPNRLQQELARRGSKLLTVILLPLNGARRALIALRLPDASRSSPE